MSFLSPNYVECIEKWVFSKSILQPSFLEQCCTLACTKMEIIIKFIYQLKNIAVTTLIYLLDLT